MGKVSYIRCVMATETNRYWITVGEVYKIENGCFMDDEGDVWGEHPKGQGRYIKELKTAKDLNRMFRYVQFEDVSNNPKLRRKKNV